VLKEPSAPLRSISLVRGSGCIVSRKALAQAGGRFTTEPPAMSGPYLLKEWQPKQKTILARDPDFYGPAPDLEEVHIFPIEDEKTAEIAFEAGARLRHDQPVLAAGAEEENPRPASRSSSGRRCPTSGSA
jgi:peptide/nickel transport system substrate-binding protein